MAKLNEVQKRVLAAYKRQVPRGYPKSPLHVSENVSWGDFCLMTPEGTVVTRTFTKTPQPWIILAWWRLLKNRRVSFSFESLDLVQEQIEERREILKAAQSRLSSQRRGVTRSRALRESIRNIISLFYHAAEVFEPAASDTRIETDAYWVLTVIQYMGRFCGFSATIDPETLKITVQVIQKPPVYFRAVG
jgi:hypothetical protein